MRKINLSLSKFEYNKLQQLARISKLSMNRVIIAMINIEHYINKEYVNFVHNPIDVMFESSQKIEYKENYNFIRTQIQYNG